MGVAAIMSPELVQQVDALLAAHPEGLGEYELLKALQRAGCEGFPAVSLLEPLPLFRMHFLLFHTLYRLRDQWWAEQSAHLEISALCIRKQSYHPGSAGLTQYDRLRDYYLDVSHFHNTTAEQVRALLGQFWARFHAGEQRQAALQVLGLRDPVTYAEIKRHYRSLAMLHHPDRGGDGEFLRALNQAMAVVEKYYAPVAGKPCP